MHSTEYVLFISAGCFWAFINFWFILGFASLRNPVRGSRYVQTIVKVFMEEAQNTDIQTMLTHVCTSTSEFILN